jgi:ATP-dependent DNA helicase DinG
MIAPLDVLSSPLERRTREFFSPEGPLSKARNFEFRPQQQTMAAAVAAALHQRTHLLVEAGTGVGKSLAYLVPAVLHALEHTRKAVISTHTINLQEQLFYKDIPLAQKILPDAFSAVLLKGRQNYLCPRRLDRALRHAGDLFVSSETEELKRIAEWHQRTQDGTLSDLDPAPDPKVWIQVCSEPHVCTGRTCGGNPRCFYQQARKQIQEAHVVVVNHSLFFNYLTGLEEPDEGENGYLFTNDFVIFDEAHTVENVAARHLGLGVSHAGVRYLLQRIYHPKTQKGLAQLLRRGEMVKEVADVLQTADRFFEGIETSADFKRGNEVRVTRPDLAEDLLNLPLAKLHRSLSDAASDTQDEDLKLDLQDCGRRLGALRQQIAAFLSQEQDDFVYWIERGGKHAQNLQLNAAPIDIAPVLRTRLFRPDNTVIMTSATLSVAKGLGYFQRRIGGEDATTLQVDSPFDYARQMKVYIPKTMPEPAQAEAYEKSLAQWIKHFVTMTTGKAFVLFTSYKSLQNLAATLEMFFMTSNLPLLVQGTKLPRHRLLQKFKEEKNSVLFGTDSFWQGVDVPGEALSNVILTRLPFAVPDHPLTQAKLEKIEQDGGDPFRDYSLPEAILKFRQGVGRLIRTGQDQGIIAILDNRILTKTYGKAFLAVLPKCPVEIVESTD